MASNLVQLELIFSEALAKSTPAERAAYLDQACGADKRLRGRVERLLASAVAAGSFMAPPWVNQTVASHIPPGEEPGSKIGHYELLEQIGEGGFGVVFMAEQGEPVRRRVALKIIRLGMDTRQVVARFEAERQALAMMDHPNIARVLDAGATESGRPFFVMELVRGKPITEFCDAQRLPPAQRLELFISVCQAIQHAHQKGIIHRDIKPSNVLVSLHDDKPVVKIIDFGIAKAIEARLTEKTLFTEMRQMIGTPAYMSPEQSGMSDWDIDTRSDIYSLGVLLYELLTGSTPFSTKDLRAKAFDEIQRLIRESDPPKPSTRLLTLKNDLTRVAANRQMEPARLAQIVRGDLDWIVMKCLEKDRARRYETSNDLAMEIRRYLNDEAVLVGPPGAGYRARKFIRRNRGPVIAASLVAIALVLGIIGTSIGFARAVAARRAETEQRRVAQANEKRAQTAAGKSEQVAKFLTDMLEGVGPWEAQGRDTTLLKEILDRTNQRAAKELKGEPEVESAIRMAIGKVYYELNDFEEAEATFSEALRLARTAFGEEHVEVAYAMHDIAETRYGRGDLEGAEKLESEVYAMRKRLLGENHPDVAWSINRLGMIKHMRNQIPEAEGLYRKALGIIRQARGDDRSDITLVLNNLSMAMRSRGAAEESEVTLRQAVNTLRRVSGNLDPSIAYQVGNLGTLLCMRGKLAASESMCREAVSRYTKVSGAAHPDTLKAIDDLATVLQREEKLQEAEATLREALDSSRTVPAKSHSPTLLLMRRLAEVLDERGKRKEACTLARTTLEAYLDQQNPGPGETSYAFTTLIDHAAGHGYVIDLVGATSHAFSVLIETLSDAGKRVESAAELQRELEWLHKNLSPDDPRLAYALFDTAAALQRTGMITDAEPVLRDCLDICNKKAFPNTYDQGWTTCNATSMLGEAIAESTQPVHEKANARTPATAESPPADFTHPIAGVSRRASEQIARLDEAERLLLSGYDGIKDMPYVYWPVETCHADCKRRAMERIVRLYELRQAAEPRKGYDAKAAKWRIKLAEYQANAQQIAHSPTTTTPPDISAPSTSKATNRQ